MVSQSVRGHQRESNVSVTRVVLTHVSSGTYYADLVLMPDGEEVIVSSRPSDAIAIALRASCPSYVSDELIDMVGEAIEEEEEAQEQSGIIDEFKNFIENINPEDFA